MDTYVILRRSGWRSPYEEGGGSVGTVCVYQASSPEAIQDHASRADLPADEIIPVADTVLVRPDPEAATA